MPRNITVDDISPVIVYAGNWTDYSDQEPNRDPASKLYAGNTFHSSGMPGSTATIRFNGTAIYIYGSKQSHHGYYSVSVDDEIPQTFDGYGKPPAGSNLLALTNQLLFVRTDLKNGLHEVVFTNVEGSNGRRTIDIDYVTWTADGDPLSTTILDDTDENWTYTGPWNLRAGNDIFQGSTHFVNKSGAQASVRFEGVGIYLYGHLWKDHGKFNVSIDDAPPVTLNSFASTWFAQVMLYYADGLDPGTHTLTVTNAEEGKALSLDYVRVLNPENSTVIHPPPLVGNAKTVSNAGMIGSIIGGGFALVILTAFLTWFWVRRRGQYKSVDIVEPSNVHFIPPPIGYAPRSTGPGWLDAGSQSHHASYANSSGEKMAIRSSNDDRTQLAPNPRLMAKLRGQVRG